MLYAQWGKGLKITYDGNGQAEGQPPVDDKNPYLKDTKATVKGSNGMTKPGYVFRGWCTKKDYTGAVYKEGDTIDVTGDTVLYAHWVKAIPITYDGNGNDDGTAPVDETAPYGAGDQITILDSGDLYKKGHVFKNWNSEPDGSGKSYNPKGEAQIKEELTLYAQWKKVEPNGTDVTVLYRKNAGEQGTAPVDTKSPYKHGAEATVLDCADMSKDGYAFVGWTNRLAAGGKVYKPGHKITLAASMIFYPEWKEDGSAGGDPEGEKRTPVLKFQPLAHWKKPAIHSMAGILKKMVKGQRIMRAEHLELKKIPFCMLSGKKFLWKAQNVRLFIEIPMQQVERFQLMQSLRIRKIVLWKLWTAILW